MSTEDGCRPAGLVSDLWNKYYRWFINAVPDYPPEEQDSYYHEHLEAQRMVTYVEHYYAMRTFVHAE